MRLRLTTDIRVTHGVNDVVTNQTSFELFKYVICSS